MKARIDTYYDFRSPYAYFADYRVRNAGPGQATKVESIGRPIFIDVILNPQSGREPWARSRRLNAPDRGGLWEGRVWDAHIRLESGNLLWADRLDVLAWKVNRAVDD